MIDCPPQLFSALPFAFFTLSESDLEDQLTYELTRAALDEATRQGIMKVE